MYVNFLKDEKPKKKGAEEKIIKNSKENVEEKKHKEERGENYIIIVK